MVRSNSTLQFSEKRNDDCYEQYDHITASDLSDCTLQCAKTNLLIVPTLMSDNKNVLVENVNDDPMC